MSQTIVDQQMEIELGQEKINSLENSLADYVQNVKDKDKTVSCNQ